MRYMLMICGDDSGLDVADVAEMPGCEGWAEEMTRRGVLRGGAGLQPSSTAVTVRVRDGRPLILDGPFAETKDQIGGFALVECADMDEAIEVAAKHPAARQWTIEVRPIMEP